MENRIYVCWAQNIIFMNISPRRKKKCEIQFEKENYLRHLGRLENLRNGKSPHQMHKLRDLQKLSLAMHECRKIHAKSRNYRINEMKSVQRLSHQTNYAKVCSIVKKNFISPSPVIAPRHKRCNKTINEENEKLFVRIVNAKSEFKFLSRPVTERLFKEFSQANSADLLQLYHGSSISKPSEHIYKVKLGKSRQNFVFLVEFSMESLLSIIKDSNSPYLLQVMEGELKGNTSTFIPSEHKTMKISLKMPKKNNLQFAAKFKIIKIFDNKDLLRLTFALDPSDLMLAVYNNFHSHGPESRLFVEKELKNSRGQTEGKIGVNILNCNNPKLKSMDDGGNLSKSEMGYDFATCF